MGSEMCIRDSRQFDRILRVSSQTPSQTFTDLYRPSQHRPSPTFVQRQSVRILRAFLTDVLTDLHRRPHRPSPPFTDLHRHCAPPVSAHSASIPHRRPHRLSQTFTALHRPSPTLRAASLRAFCAHSSQTSVEVLPPVGEAPHRMRADARRLSTLLFSLSSIVIR